MRERHREHVTQTSSRYSKISAHGFFRIAASSVPVRLGDPYYNAERIAAMVNQANAHSAALVAFPELCLVGYTSGDLLLSDRLHELASEALQQLVVATRDLSTACIIGLPIRDRHKLYNCACVIHQGMIKGIVPKTFLPNFSEFYEQRYFSSGDHTSSLIELGHFGLIPFGTDLLFTIEQPTLCRFAIELCHDLWVPESPVSTLLQDGATLIVNLSASSTTLHKHKLRHQLLKAASYKACCGYLFANAGAGESTTDLVWDGATLIYEHGVCLAEGKRFTRGEQMVIADLDLHMLENLRRKDPCFRPLEKPSVPATRTVRLEGGATSEPYAVLYRSNLSKVPFLMTIQDEDDPGFEEILAIQCDALAQRLGYLNMDRVTLGLSGGLDSAYAACVVAKTFDQLSLPRANIMAYGLPALATQSTSLGIARQLSKALGLTFQEVSIVDDCERMLNTLDHPASRKKLQASETYDVTYENVQAGIRASYLFRFATMHNSLVIGTSDLSELALGWCTYGIGDHMSHYALNAGVTKTTLQAMLIWFIQSHCFKKACSKALEQVLDAAITPELVPNHEQIVHQTEAQLGPYLYHDFILYWVLEHGMTPSKVMVLAETAWNINAKIPQNPVLKAFLERFDRPWDRNLFKETLSIFCRRFFSQQYKRSALPDGPKVLSVALSPRGDWRAPSEFSSAYWIADLENV